MTETRRRRGVSDARGLRVQVICPVALWRDCLAEVVASVVDGGVVSRRSAVDDGESPDQVPDVVVVFDGRADRSSADPAPTAALVDEARRHWPASRIVLFGPDNAGGSMPGVITVAFEATVARFADVIGGTAGAARRPWEAPVIAPVALTKRELSVLALIADGCSAAEVAATLGVSSRTVEGHKQRIFAKWGVRSQSQAVELAMRNGFLRARSA